MARDPGFEKTVLPLTDKLHKRALRLTRHASEADDLVQETLLRAWRFWHTFEPGTGADRWLYTILRNTFSTRCQRSNRRQEVVDAAGRESAPLMAEVATPDLALEAAQVNQAVREAVATLPEVYREAVRLADLEGYSYREVATTLGCPEGTVMSRIYRGRRQLAALLAG